MVFPHESECFAAVETRETLRFDFELQMTDCVGLLGGEFPRSLALCVTSFCKYFHFPKGGKNIALVA